MQRYLHLVLLCCTFVLFGQPAVSAEETSGNVVLLPFNVEKAGKYGALKDAIKSMLTTRLAEKRGITVAEGALTVNETGAFIAKYPDDRGIVFEKLSADFIGLGTLNSTSDELRFEMEFYAKEGSPAKNILVVVKEDNKIFDAVDLLADRIAEKVFGHTPESQIVGTTTDAPSGMDAFQTAHPDRKYKEDLISGVSVFAGEEFESIAKGDIVRRRSGLSDGVISLAVGDIDGAGGEEIVVAAEQNIKIFHYEKSILKQLAEYSFPPETRVHGLNLADLDGDGQVEIYVSSTVEGRLSSFILQWDGTATIAEILTEIRWAIRPLETPEDGLVLLGQSKSRQIEVYLEPGVHILEIDENTKSVKKGKKLFLPPRLNLFDFIYADIDGDGLVEKAAITNNLRLAIYDRDNRLSWISEDSYGGSVKYLGSRWNTNDGSGTDLSSTFSDDENYIELQYVPPRLVAEDINKDGKTDIIVVKNILSTFEALSNFRSFRGGKIACLSWNGIKMTEIWQTDLQDGFIADLDFISYSSNLMGDDSAEEGAEKNTVHLILGQVPSDGFTNIFNFFGDDANLFVYEFKVLEKSDYLEKDS